MRVYLLTILVAGLVACSDDDDGGGGGGGKSAPADEEAEDDTGEEDEEPAIVEGNDGKLRFLTPSTNDQVKLDGETYELSVEFGDVAPTARWGLYYTPNEKSFLGGVAIIEDLPITTSGVPWDVNFVDPGTYYVYGMLTDSSVTTVHFAPGSFKIEGEASGNSAPTVSLASPAGDQIYAPGEDLAITFTGSDKEEDDFTFKVEFTANGKDWTTLADKIAQTENQYVWSVPGDAEQTARYQIRVTADDGKNSSTATTPKPFGITDQNYTFTTDIAPVFDAKCAFSGCHVGSNPDAGLDLSQYNDNGAAMTLGAASKTEAIQKRTRKGGGMPQADSPNGDLSGAERDLIQFWYWQDTPN